MALNDWLPTVNTELKLVLAPAHRGALPTNPITSVSLLIGPEGGLSELEIQLAKQHHFQAWQIGPRVLRTETAPVAALALLQAKWETSKETANILWCYTYLLHFYNHHTTLGIYAIKTTIERILTPFFRLGISVLFIKRTVSMLGVLGKIFVIK